jgi:hypothetical protein
MATARSLSLVDHLHTMEVHVSSKVERTMSLNMVTTTTIATLGCISTTDVTRRTMVVGTGSWGG